MAVVKAPGRAIEGLRRVLAAPRVVLAIWAVNLLVALPAAVAVGDSLRRSIGSSEAGERLLGGFDFGWHGELMAEAGPLVGSLEPGRLVSGGWLVNLDAWWSGGLFTQPAPILAFGGLFALAWILLSGGALAHFHRPPRRFAVTGFAADAGAYFFRFLRLALLSAPLYYGIFRLARWVFPRIERATADVTVERTLFIYYLLAAALVVFLLATIKMGFDYAKVVIVVGERRSAFLAALSGFGFALRRPLATYGLLIVFAALGAALLAARELTAPGVERGSLAVVVAVFVLGQAFLLARLVARLGLLAAELALYEEKNR